MNNFNLNWKDYGYRVKKKLGENLVTGRVTYLAQNLATEQQVIIKQFQFTRIDSTETEYDAYQSKIEVLKSLNHESIPTYLDSFKTPTGFCLVQEYKNAVSLAKARHLSLEDIKEIAISILIVINYLQRRSPTIIHQDIKPENILLDRSQGIKIYLVDFGLAPIDGRELVISNVVKGTLGFMPPEQIFNRQLTNSSDLYSLGITLICLLTETKQTEISNLIDLEQNQLNFKDKLAKLNPLFLKWLDKMICPKPNKRYADAHIAINALHSLEIIKPKINLRKNIIKYSPFIIIALMVTGLAIAIILPYFRAFQEVNEVNNYLIKREHKAYFNGQVFEMGTGNCVACNLEGYRATVGNNIIGADLRKANLKNAQLDDVNISSSDLAEANLEQTQLNNADLSHTYLRKANLQNSQLQNANLTNANLREANLSNANLQQASLVGAKLENANLSNANLTGVDFSGANLENANFRGANLSDSNVYRAYEYGANFSGALMPDGTIHK